MNHHVLSREARINRIAEGIVSHRRDNIEDLADVVWYVTEEAEYEALNEVDHEAVVAAVAAKLGIEVTR